MAKFVNKNCYSIEISSKISTTTYGEIYLKILIVLKWDKNFFVYS